MKTLIALFATCLSLLGSEQQQTFVISNKPLDITKTFKVKQFDPDKGTLNSVEIQARWEWATESADFEIDLELVAPGPSSVNQSFSNIETHDACCGWSLAVGIDPSSVGYSSYIGEGTVDFDVSFAGVSLPEPAKGSLKLTVTYTYDP